MVFQHTSVLTNECIERLSPPENFPRGKFVYVDATIGGAGHAQALVQRFKSSPPQSLSLIGFDRDEDALRAAESRLRVLKQETPFFDYVLVHKPFSEFINYWKTSPLGGDQKIFGFFADLGVSSPQLDQPHRGFSFLKEGPLDMRMDRRSALTAQEILETYSEEALARLFFEYGEEPRSRKLARAIVQDRKTGLKFKNTLDFAEYVRRVLGYPHSRMHPATRVFQALRIEVNQELQELSSLLEGLPPLMCPGGRAAFLSFHSLEDRLIKQTFRRWQKPEINPWEPFEGNHNQSQGREEPRGGIVASPEECQRNPRARSARLRCFVFGASL